MKWSLALLGVVQASNFNCFHENDSFKCETQNADSLPSEETKLGACSGVKLTLKSIAVGGIIDQGIYAEVGIKINGKQYWPAIANPTQYYNQYEAGQYHSACGWERLFCGPNPWDGNQRGHNMCFCDVRQNGGSAWIGGEELIIPGPDVGATTIMVEDLDPFGEAVWYHAAAESQWSFLINQKHARFVEKKCGDATSEEKDFELILETSAEKKKKWEVRASVKPKVEVEAPPLTAGVEAELGGTYSESWTQAATHLKIRGTIEGVPV